MHVGFTYLLFSCLVPFMNIARTIAQEKIIIFYFPPEQFLVFCPGSSFRTSFQKVHECAWIVQNKQFNNGMRFHRRCKTQCLYSFPIYSTSTSVRMLSQSACAENIPIGLERWSKIEKKSWGKINTHTHTHTGIGRSRWLILFALVLLFMNQVFISFKLNTICAPVTNGEQHFVAFLSFMVC